MGLYTCNFFKSVGNAAYQFKKNVDLIGTATLKAAPGIFTPAAFFGCSTKKNLPYEVISYCSIALIGVLEKIKTKHHCDESTQAPEWVKAIEALEAALAGYDDVQLPGLILGVYRVFDHIPITYRATVLTVITIVAGIFGLTDLIDKIAKLHSDAETETNNIYAHVSHLIHAIVKPMHLFAGIAFSMPIWFYADLSYASPFSIIMFSLIGINIFLAEQLQKYKQAHLNEKPENHPLWVKSLETLYAALTGFNKVEVLALIVGMFHDLNDHSPSGNTTRTILTSIAAVYAAADGIEAVMKFRPKKEIEQSLIGNSVVINT